jgi:hypothetical protein
MLEDDVKCNMLRLRGFNMFILCLRAKTFNHAGQVESERFIYIYIYIYYSYMLKLKEFILIVI